MNVLTANLLLSTLVFWIAAKIYLLCQDSMNYDPKPYCCQCFCCTHFGISV
jgi:hypothetical protein